MTRSIQFSSPAAEQDWQAGVQPLLRFVVRQFHAILGAIEPEAETIITSLFTGRDAEPHRSRRAADLRARGLRPSTVRCLLVTLNEAFRRPVDADGVQRWTVLLESPNAEDLAPYRGLPGVVLNHKASALHFHVQVPRDLPDGIEWHALL